MTDLQMGRTYLLFFLHLKPYSFCPSRGKCKIHPPTQVTTPACCNRLRCASTASAVQECIAPDGDFPTYPSLASADFAAGRMTRRSLRCCVPNRISAHWRSRVSLLGTTGLPVRLHCLAVAFGQTVRQRTILCR